jgi:uncharacterized membrane protein
LIEPYSKNRTIRFHAFQSIFFWLAWIAISIALSIVFGILAMALPFGVRTLLYLVLRLIHLVLLGGLIFMAVKAYQRQRFVLPVIGPLAEKQAG